MKIVSAVCSATGKVRGNNQDNYYFNGKILTRMPRGNIVLHEDKRRRKEHIFAVCDGMGGEAKGEVASLIAVTELSDYCNKYKGKIFDMFEGHVEEYTQIANNAICAERKKNNYQRMGTTYILLCISNNRAMIANIGDSKAFICRDKSLHQMNVDHTHAETLFRLGYVTKEDEKYKTDKSILTQHLGIFPNDLIIEPFISEGIELEREDVILLCSDGLTDMVDEEDIAAILSEKNGPKKKVRRLVEAALHNGGKDNITAIVVQHQKGFRL